MVRKKPVIQGFGGSTFQRVGITKRKVSKYGDLNTFDKHKRGQCDCSLASEEETGRDKVTAMSGTGP